MGGCPDLKRLTVDALPRTGTNSYHSPYAADADPEDRYQRSDGEIDDAAATQFPVSKGTASIMRLRAQSPNPVIPAISMMAVNSNNSSGK